MGRQVNGACPNDAPALIVGWVADSKLVSVESKAEPELYFPYVKFPFASFLVTFVIRTSSNPTDVAAAVRRAVLDVDRDQPVIQVRTMENVISESLWWERVSGLTLGIFAAISLLLAAVGISCLSGCFSKPQAVVCGRAAPRVSENLARVPVDVRYRSGLPEVSGGVPLARRLHLPKVREPEFL